MAGRGLRGRAILLRRNCTLADKQRKPWQRYPPPTEGAGVAIMASPVAMVSSAVRHRGGRVLSAQGGCGYVMLTHPYPRNRLPRQGYGQVGAGSRKGREWRATPTFVSTGRFDPTPSFLTIGLLGPVQPDGLPPMRWVFVVVGRVLPVGWPQNRHGSIPLTLDKGVDTTGRESRFSWKPDCHK
jgi:hypothetical protein